MIPIQAHTDLDAIDSDLPLNRPMVYVDNGITYYRASSLLQCPRAFIFSRLGNPTKIPPNLQTAFDYGTANEGMVIEMLEARGRAVTQLQFALEIPILPNIKLTGHLDGMIHARGANRIDVLEIKCLSHANTELFRDNWQLHFPYYAWQMSVYMHAMKRAGEFAILDKETDELHEITVPTPPVSLKELMIRIQDLEDYYVEYQKNDILPVCETATFCPFYHLHKDYDDTPQTTPLLDRSIGAYVDAYAIISAKIAALESAKSALRSRLETALGTVTSGRTATNIVTRTEYQTTRLKTAEVKKYLKTNSVLDAYTETTTATRLTVTKVGEE